MPEIATVTRIADLRNRVGQDLPGPPPGQAFNNLVLNYLNGPPHNFGVQSVRGELGGQPEGRIKIFIRGPANMNQQAIFAALR